jgi:hypothetical protein
MRERRTVVTEVSDGASGDDQTPLEAGVNSRVTMGRLRCTSHRLRHVGRWPRPGRGELNTEKRVSTSGFPYARHRRRPPVKGSVHQQLSSR